jgi:Lrp/AsnC family leucine-responsive transcriptional regulator
MLRFRPDEFVQSGGQARAFSARQARAERDLELDDFDRRLLNLVQSDAGQTAERLAASLGLSPSAVQRRLRRLRETGVIVRETAIIDPKWIGNPVSFVVALQVERERPQMLSQLRAWLEAEACIQQAFYVTGEADFILVVTATDTAAYDAQMVRLMTENPNVKRFTTNVALGIVKRGLAIPIPSSSQR